MFRQALAFGETAAANERLRETRLGSAEYQDYLGKLYTPEWYELEKQRVANVNATIQLFSAWLKEVIDADKAKWTTMEVLAKAHPAQ